jgi:hypothetical protein
MAFRVLGQKNRFSLVIFDLGSLSLTLDSYAYPSTLGKIMLRFTAKFEGLNSYIFTDTSTQARLASPTTKHN